MFSIRAKRTTSHTQTHTRTYTPHTEHIENTASFLVNETGDALDTPNERQKTTDGGCFDTNLAMAFSAYYFEEEISFEN